MTPVARLGAFAAALVVVFVVALGVGGGVGPIDVGEPSPDRSHGVGHDR